MCTVGDGVFALDATQGPHGTAVSGVERANKGVLRITLSKDPVERARQVQFVQDKIGEATVHRANKSISQNDNDLIAGGSGCSSIDDDGAGGCVNTWEVSTGGWYGGDGYGSAYVQQVVHLEPVTVTGQSMGCRVWVSSNWGGGYVPCNEFANHMQTEFEPLRNRVGPAGFKNILGDIGNLVDIVTPLLPTCATVPTSDSIKNPDADEAIQWKAAGEAIAKANAGNFGSLRKYQRSDVKYPNGSVVQLIIIGVTKPAPGLPDGYIGVGGRFGNGFPGADSPCN